MAATYDEGDYDEGDYGEGDYDEGDYGEGDYDEGDYDEGDYDEGDYDEGDYDEEHGHPCYCNDCYDNDKYGRSHGNLPGDDYEYPTTDPEEIAEINERMRQRRLRVPKNECPTHGPIPKPLDPICIIWGLRKVGEIGNSYACRKCVNLFLEETELEEIFRKDSDPTTLLIELCKIWNVEHGFIPEIIGKINSNGYINFQNKHGNTALHYIAYAYIHQGPGLRNYVIDSIVDTAVKLLEKGADLSIPNKEGKTPYDLFQYGYTKFSDPSFDIANIGSYDRHMNIKARTEFFLDVIQCQYANFDIKTPDEI